MKKCLFVLMAVSLVLSACTKAPHSQEFTWTDCASTKSGADTKGRFGDNVTSRLILEYTSSGLAVTRTNATLNCIYDKVGLACEPTIEGDVLQYKVYIPSEEAANCVCLCERMSSTVSGLEEGKEYVLEYSSPDAKLGKISFKYKRGLRLSVDVDDYRVWD